MDVVIDRSIIGQKVCYLEQSVVSDTVHCRTAKVTGYMVEKFDGNIIARVRLDNGVWERASRLFYPEEEGLARRRLEEKLKGIGK